MHAPSPSHILRIHTSHVTDVRFSTDNERLYSGDSSGNVVVTSTRTLRPVAAWKAHSDGILGVQEWSSNIVTHGRDNKLHVWERVVALPVVGTTATSPDIPTPALRYSLDVNALNFCRISLLPYKTPHQSSSSASESALVAVPNLIESSVADVWELPSCSRLHAAIGKPDAPEIGMRSWDINSEGRGNAKTGILMALYLFMKAEQLHLLSAYESGEVALRRCISSIHEKTIEGRGWECLWRTRQHAEPVMTMTVAPDSSFALTVSADPTVVRYELTGPKENHFVKHRIKQAGNSNVTSLCVLMDVFVRSEDGTAKYDCTRRRCSSPSARWYTMRKGAKRLPLLIRSYHRPPAREASAKVMQQTKKQTIRQWKKRMLRELRTIAWLFGSLWPSTNRIYTWSYDGPPSLSPCEH